MIRLRSLGVTYPEFRLGPMDLEVAAGERVALVGPNGAGKSTTLSALSGRLPAYEGSVAVEGREVREHTVSVRAHVGVVPEELLGLGWLTVLEHLDLLSHLYAGWDAAYARDLSERLELPGSTKLANLSKGTMVKLSLVAAEAFRPPVLLLDEPTSGIDPLMRAELLALLDCCVPRGGLRTVIFSTHILEDVESIAERVLLLRSGRLVGDASVEELRSGDPGQALTGILRELLADG